MTKIYEVTFLCHLIIQTVR